MNELFSPAHFIWIIPLACFGLFILAVTCYFLRREISSFFKRMFFPDTKRYTMPGAIISNVNTEDKPAAAEQKAEEKKEEVPAEVKTETKEKAAVKETALDPKEPVLEDEDKGLLRKTETSIRWDFRKVKHAFNHWFATFAGTEDAPAKTAKTMKAAATGTRNPLLEENKETSAEVITPLLTQGETEATKTENAEEETTQHPIDILAEDITEEETSEDTTEQKETEDKETLKEENTPQETEVSEDENKEEVKEENNLEITEELKESLPTAILPAQPTEESPKVEESSPANNLQEKKEETKEDNKTEEKKPFLSDRTAVIIAMLILAGFVIFLSARVKLLGSIVKRQHVEIKNMQKQLEIHSYEQGGVKVVIHNRAIFPQKRYNK